MGVRAYAGTRHAAMLYHEARSESCDPMLARENAADMERLADEILARGRRLEAVLSEDEARVIGADLTRMQVLALRARRLAAELGVWIDEAMQSDAESGNAAATPAAAASATAAGLAPELAARVADRSRELFGCFKQILLTHKSAERQLGIPVPADPPD